MLILLVTRLSGHTTTTYYYYLASVVLSNPLFYFALVVLYRLIQTEFNAQVAKKAGRLLSFFPYSLFFSVDYTGSLFLLLAVSVFLF